MRKSADQLEYDSPDTARYFAALREHWLLVGLVVLVAVAASIAYGATRSDVYEAAADVLVTPVPPEEDVLNGLGLLRDPSGSVFTASRLVESHQVTNRVIRQLDLPLSREEVLDRLEITPLQQSNLVSIVATEKSPAAASALANATAQALLAERTEVFQSRLGGTLERLRNSRAALRPVNAAERSAAADLDDRIRFLDSYVGDTDPTLAIWTEAVPPDSAKPKSPFGYIAGFFAALILGAGLALLLEILSPTMRREYELPAGAAVLTRVPHVPKRVMRQYLSGGRPLPPQLWESYRVLRAGIAGVGADSGSQVILVTSAIKGEGKTTTSANLALAFAAAGQRVVLVDANLRDQRAARIFGADPRQPGLVEVLARQARVTDALVPAGVDRPTLSLLLAGDAPERGVDLLDSGRVEQLVADLRGEAEVVVIDSPPLTEFAEATALADSVDVVLLAVRLGRSRQDRLLEAMRMLARRGAPVAGIVLTDRRRLRRSKLEGAEPIFEPSEPRGSLTPMP